MEDIDIWRAAEQMRKLYGPDATIQSAMRPDKLMDQGDVEGFAEFVGILVGDFVCASGPTSYMIAPGEGDPLLN